MNAVLASFGAGVVFALGLGLAGMTQPAKVFGFLNVFGTWDPSLAFVMGGAIAVHAVAVRLAAGRPAPILAERFSGPTRTAIDGRLLGGAALFGVGWGLGGYCPGPAIVSLASLDLAPIVVVVGMIAGMLAHDLRASSTAPVSAPADAVPAGGAATCSDG